MSQQREYILDCPDLLKEWDYELNGNLQPDAISSGNSRTKINWICSKCGHKWAACAYNRARQKKGCPECGKVSRSVKMKQIKFRKGVNDLASQRPDLLQEWDFESNAELSPYEITIGNSSNPVNWICSNCGNKWSALVVNRVHQNSGCPECAKKAISRKSKERLFNKNNSLCIVYPDIAFEWHPTLNNRLLVENIMPGSKDVVWWRCCVCGYSYQAKVVSRTGYKHAGCPQCNRRLHTSFPEQAIFYYVRRYFNDAQNGFTEVFNEKMELDIYIPSMCIGIEYDGEHWHRDTKCRNLKKYELCTKLGIWLIRVKENYNGKICDEHDADEIIFRTHDNDAGLEECILQVLRSLSQFQVYDVDITRDSGQIRSNYVTTLKNNSLLTKYPQVAKEWHPNLNGNLRPDMFFPASHAKVWWLCSQCGQPYVASISRKTRKERFKGCPICAGKKIVPGVNDLASQRPDLAIDWHPILNGNLKPTEVAPNYGKKVWWKCNICGNEYYCTPNKRISRNQRCVECRKHQRGNK